MWKLGSRHVRKNKDCYRLVAMHFVCSSCKEIMEGTADVSWFTPPLPWDGGMARTETRFTPIT